MSILVAGLFSTGRWALGTAGRAAALFAKVDPGTAMDRARVAQARVTWRARPGLR
jgi:hypothetical protein